jgi:hypothetical protein
VDGRRLFALLVGAAVLAFGASVLCAGYAETWRAARVPAMTPFFADLRVLTSAGESYAAGHDPRASNPRDPWRRPLNYPRIWDLALVAGMGVLYLLCRLAPRRFRR